MSSWGVIRTRPVRATIDRAVLSARSRDLSRFPNAVSLLPTQTRVMTSEAFWPPKPKLLEMAVSSGISRDVLGT